MKKSSISTNIDTIFNTLDDLYLSEDYNNIKWLKIIDHSFSYSFKLPESLETLIIVGCQNCEFIERLPDTIFLFEITNTVITDVSHLLNPSQINLETILLNQNRLTKMPNYIPENVRTINMSNNNIQSFPEYNIFPNEINYIDLSYNNLITVPNWLLDLNEETEIDLSNNNFWFSSHANISINREIITDFHITMARRFFGSNIVLRFESAMRKQNNYIQHNNDFIVTKTIAKTTAEQKQNVHTSSIQDSFSKSVENIMNYDKPYNENFRDEIESYYLKINCNIIKIGKSSDQLFLELLNKSCQDQTLSSRAGVTFEKLLERIWTISSNHEDKTTIRSILKQEILDGAGMCFTGRITRLVNVLSGLYDGVQITYNETEQINNAIIAVIRRCEKDHTMNLLNEAKKTLIELNVPEERHNEWLESL